MSQIFPKNKEKRPRTSSNEASNSFVKNVTSRVSGLLPSTITKWFSSPSSSNANGSMPTVDASDSSEDEASEAPVITQPPAKRMRFSTPGTYNHYGPADASCSTSDVEIIEIPYSPFSGTQFGQPSRNTFTTPLRPPNEDQEKMERDTPSVFKPSHTVTSIGQSIANKRKSIFDTTTREETVKAVAKSSSNTMRDPKQPNFKPSLLGSPFYPGRTMYGGAASSYINQPNIKQQTVAVVNESKSNDDTAISSSARRIMDLLESYSSPVMEARRIPLYTKPKNDGFANSERHSPYTNRSLSYKTQELHVPSIASILRLKKKSRLMDTTNAARQIIASHSSASNFPTYPTETKGKELEKEQPNKMTTKVKSRLTRTNRGNQDELEMATPVKLPTAVLQLDKDKLPQFSFGTPPVSKLPATSTPKTIFPTADKNITQVSTSKHETVTNSVFKFSNPVKVSSETPQVDSTPPKFTFENPEQRIDQKIESKHDDCSVVVGIVKEPEEFSIQKSKDWQCADCWVKNKSEANKCVCCGAKQPKQNAKCSVCKLADSLSQKDLCENCEKKSLSKVASPLTPKLTGVSQSSKWKCLDCWVSNDDSVDKCACCGGRRPRELSGANASATVTSITATDTPKTVTSQIVPLKAAPVTSKVDADWKCDDCWISNKSSVDKCAACGGTRPGAKQSSTVDVPANTTSFFGSRDDKFKTIVKSQKSDKWECSSCLVRNESDKNRCVCCGAEKESKNKIPESKFNFGTIPNNSFKFGIDPKVQEATITKNPEVIPTLESKLKPQSETNNNVLAETPTFTFTLPTKKIEIKTDASKEKSDEAPKMNFTFGIPKSIPTSTVVTNKLESNKVLEEEKLQEVPSVDLNSPVQNKPHVSPLTQTNNENKTLTSVILPNTLANDAKKDMPLNSVALPGASDTEKSKPAFSFGVTPNKLFQTPGSMGTSMNLFMQQSQATTVTTTSPPTLSLFKPAETSTSTTSLFQPPDLTAKPTPLFQNSEKTNNSAPGTQPMFTFGNNGLSNPAPPAVLTLPAAPEKPKFQFTFGSNPTPKTDPPPLFKSPFAAPESNLSTNTFNLPAGTTLGSSNNLSSNTLVGSNGLPGANGPTGNAMVGNTLGAMSGSSLSGNTLTIGNGGTLGGTNGLSTNPLSGGSSIQPGNTLTGGATGLFNNPVQKENAWSASSNAPSPNLFVSNTTTCSLPKQSTFTFGCSTPFNAANSTPTFGTTAPAPQNIFGMNNQNNNAQSSMFSNAVQSQPTGNLFGSPQAASNPAPQMPMFGTPSIGATPTFGSPNPSIPSFEAPSLTPTPGTTFTFGGAQSTPTPIFGFGQQQQLQQQQMQQQHLQQQQQQQLQSPPQTGVYSFGGAPAGAPQVQFSMGSGANPAVRRVRKAVRRNPQR